MLAVVEYYLVPYGLVLGATTQQIGFLVAVPHLLASISQLFAVRAVRCVGGRLDFLVRAASLQAAFLLPLALLALKPFPGQIEALIVLTVLFRVLNSLIATAWGSLVSDYLPTDKRGTYFGWRSQVAGMASVAGMGLAGIVLFLMKKVFPALGFLLVFLSASLCRFVSASLLSKMVDLPLPPSPDQGISLRLFLRRFKESPLGRFILYVSGMLFVTFLAAPYFSVFMLRDLQFNYLNYVCVHLAAVVAGVVSYPIWGRHADLVGNARILKATGATIPLIPLLWLFSHSLLYLVFVEAFSGFVWGGFMLCATNFIYDSVHPEGRVKSLGTFNLMNGVAIFAGASLGGALTAHLPPFRGFSLLTLFALSGGFRLAVHLFLSGRFQEVRDTVKAVSRRQLFLSVVGIRPLTGLDRHFRGLPSVKEVSSEM